MESGEAIPSRASLEKQYVSSSKALELILSDMVARIQRTISEAGLSPAYKHRLKTFQSYFAKRIKLYREAVASGAPTPPLTDILAVRVICPFIGDLERVESALASTFEITQIERKGRERSFKEFGYESTHLLLKVPGHILGDLSFLDPPVCEVQVRTILQDAWAEVEHELVYKAEFTPFDEPMKRKLAALNANLTLSDMLFQEIRDYQHQLTTELAKRRVAFFKKIEDAIDKEMFAAPAGTSRTDDGRDRQPAWLGPWKSLDDLLLEALNAHNRADYIRAIDIYSHILALDPKPEIRSLILKHRGMAYFAESLYDESLEDFSSALELDAKCYKSAYYRGVVYSVKKRYPAAIEDFSRALAIQPYHFYSTLRRAQAYFHIDDYPAALADCETALQLEPENEALLKLRAMVLKKLRM